MAIQNNCIHYMLQVGNKLHGCRFKLQESAKKLQECMNSLEKEHAWQDHTAQLTSLLELHQTAIQVTLCDLPTLKARCGMVCHTAYNLKVCCQQSRHVCAMFSCIVFLGASHNCCYYLLFKLKKTSERATIDRCKLAGRKELAGDKCGIWYNF